MEQKRWDAFMLFTRRFMCVSAASVLAGCANTYTRPEVGIGQAQRLSRQTSVYVALPADGRYGGKVYAGSGAEVARMMSAAFAKQAQRVAQAERIDPKETALQSARARGMEYVAITTISHWENRATAWSGLPDRAEVIVEVLRTEDGSMVAKSVIGGRSTSVTLANIHPQDVLRAPLDAYVASLFA